MIKAIIFDCFGVLTTDGWLPFKRRHFGGQPDLQGQATDMNKMVDAGLADYDEFIQGVAGLARIDAAQARKEIENNVMNSELFQYIHEVLKPDYKVGLLSNAGANWLGELFGPENAAVFDVVCLSCDTGFVKPDARSYTGAAEALGVQPEECIFVDDQERYCSGARQTGMHAVLYEDFEQCKSGIEHLLHGASGDTEN